MFLSRLKHLAVTLVFLKKKRLIKNFCWFINRTLSQISEFHWRKPLFTGVCFCLLWLFLFLLLFATMMVGKIHNLSWHLLQQLPWSLAGHHKDVLLISPKNVCMECYSDKRGCKCLFKNLRFLEIAVEF